MTKDSSIRLVRINIAYVLVPMTSHSRYAVWRMPAFYVALVLVIIETESRVQGANCKFEELLVDDDQDLNLRGADHKDIDANIGQRSEHSRSNTCGERMPTPTTDTLAMWLSELHSSAPSARFAPQQSSQLQQGRFGKP